MLNISNILLHFNAKKEVNSKQQIWLHCRETQLVLHLLSEPGADKVKMSSRGRRPDLEERRKRRKRAEIIEKIPVLTVSGASRNRNLIRSRRRSVISPLRCFLIADWSRTWRREPGALGQTQGRSWGWRRCTWTPPGMWGSCSVQTSYCRAGSY